MQLKQKTLKALCKEIASMMGKMPETACEPLRRTYQKTHSLLALTMEGLCVPAKCSRNRIEDYHWAVSREYYRIRGI